jgi:hypothetical protein
MLSTVLSFDIGTVNMAFCLAEVKHPDKTIKICQWRIVNIDLGNIERTSALCIAMMNHAFNESCLPNNKNTWVIVERQIPTNYNCFSLSYVIWTHFMTKYTKINVSFVASISKPLKTNGKKRKRESVLNAQDTLKANSESVWLQWLEGQRKKDDLTDAYIQIVGNIDKITYHSMENINTGCSAVIDLSK